MKTLEWTTIDKSSWGEGPWTSEPDKIQWQDEETGLPCLIKRVATTGALCGYVGVTQDHPLYGCDSYPGQYLDVHGGCTYVGFYQPDHAPDGSDGICHLTEPGEPDQVFWIGFDCAHAGDLMPAIPAFLKNARPSFPYSLESLLQRSDIYRDVNFVRNECKMLAKQLFDMKKELPDA